VFLKFWRLLKATVLSFIEDEALSRGAAIAFYTVTSLAPVLLIVVAVAGLAFGRDAAQNAITAQLTGLMGEQTADVLQSAIASAASKSSGILATLIGIVTLIVTASGVFGEMQTALNKIWDAEPRATTVSRLIKARAASLGLVAALGFLLLVSLVISAVLSALGNYLNAVLPLGGFILSALNFIVSLALISVLFAAIYKVLPDKPIGWHDVIAGAIVTALLFTAGKSLIGWYLGSSAVASSYGAAGGLIILLLWVYYSTQIFLLGAEFTRVYASFRRGEDPATRPTQETRPPRTAFAGTKGGRTSSSGEKGSLPSIAGERAMLATNENGSLRDLEREAERNREALMDSVSALQQRLSPTAVKHDVEDYVRTKRNSFVESLEQRARDNPIQTLAIAAGAAYPLWGLISRIPVPLLLIGAGFALSRQPPSQDGRPREGDRSFVTRAREGLGEVTDATSERIGDAAETVQQTAKRGMEAARGAADRVARMRTQASQQTADFATRAGERLSETAGSIREVGSEAVGRAGEMISTDRIKSAGTQAHDWIGDTVSRNPLVVGAVGLAIGAMIAAALPKTQQEDQYLGSVSERVKKRAQDAAAAGLDKARDVAADIYHEAMASAEEQGLSAEGLKQSAAELADKVRGVAAKATNSGTESQNTGDASYQPNSVAGIGREKL
jgi:membrane protein